MPQKPARPIRTVTSDGRITDADGNTFSLEEASRSELVRLSSLLQTGLSAQNSSDDLKSGISAELERLEATGQGTTEFEAVKPERATGTESGSESETPRVQGDLFGNPDGETESDADVKTAPTSSGKTEGETEGEGGASGEGEGETETDADEEAETETETDADEEAEPKPLDHFGDAVLEVLKRRGHEIDLPRGGTGGGLPPMPPAPKALRLSADVLAHKQLPDLLDWLTYGTRALALTGGAGLGKTFALEQAAKIAGLEFGSLSCGQLPQDHELKGYNDATGEYVLTEFVEAYEAGSTLWCFDEMDAINEATLLTMNSAIANGYMSTPRGRVERGEGFKFAATMNTYGNGATAEYVGRAPLDKASLNRFDILHWELDEALERQLCDRVNPAATARVLEVYSQVRENINAHGFHIVCSPRDSVAAVGWMRSPRWTLERALAVGCLAGQPTHILEKCLSGSGIDAEAVKS